MFASKVNSQGERRLANIWREKKRKEKSLFNTIT